MTTCKTNLAGQIFAHNLSSWSMEDRFLTQRAVRGIPSLSLSSGSSMPSLTDSSLLSSAMMGKGRSLSAALLTDITSCTEQRHSVWTPLLTCLHVIIILSIPEDISIAAGLMTDQRHLIFNSCEGHNQVGSITCYSRWREPREKTPGSNR